MLEDESRDRGKADVCESIEDDDDDYLTPQEARQVQRIKVAMVPLIEDLVCRFPRDLVVQALQDVREEQEAICVVLQAPEWISSLESKLEEAKARKDRGGAQYLRNAIRRIQDRVAAANALNTSK